MPTRDESLEVIAEQLKATNDVKKALDTLLISSSKKYKDMIIATYASPEIRSLYNALRTESQISGKKTHRRILQIPNAYVMHFLNEMFAPEYGENWLTDKQILLKVCRNEDLIKPWITVARL